MKNIRNTLVGLVGLLFVVQFAFVSSASAQSATQLERQHLNRVMDPNSNVEEFRQELTNYFTEMGNVMSLFSQITVVRERLQKNGMQPLETIVQARLSIHSATPEDLRLMRDAYAKFPGWRDAPRNINALIKPALRQQLESRLASNGGGIRSKITPDNCEDGINADISNTDISVAEAIVIAAEAVQDGIPPVFNIPAVVITAAAKGAALTLVTLKAIKDDCTGLDATAVETIVNNAKTAIINNDNANKTTLTTAITGAQTSINNTATANTTAITTAITNAQTSINNTTTANTTAITTAITNAQTAIVNNDDSNKTTIVNNDNANALTLNTNLTNAKNAIITNDNTNTTNIVNNDNSNTTTIVDNDNANTATLISNGNANTLALNDLILRSQIEADLATESNAVKVGWYLTPTANGGKLDLVQQIVTLTLANIQAAGASIGNAQSFLTKADADKAAGSFKSAYDYYRKAYKAAVN